MKKTFTRTIKTLIAAMLVVAMCFAMTACSGAHGSPEDVAEALVEAVFDDFDAKAAMDLIHEDIKEKSFEEADMDEDEIIEEMQEGLDEAKEDMEESDGSVEWEVDEAKDMDKDKLDTIKESCEEIDLEVTDGKTVEITITAFEDGEEVGELPMSIDVVEIDGDWYLASMDQINF